MTAGPAPVVLLNAFPISRIQWDGLLEEWAQTPAGERDILSFDMPGLGSTPPSPETPSLELIADAAVSALREATGRRDAIWIGCSMGGYVAMAVAQLHPDAVAGLGLIATKSVADSEQARRDRLDRADRLDTLDRAEDPEGMARGLVGRDDARGQQVIQDAAADIARHAGAAIAWGQRAMAARPDRTAVLEMVDAPAVVIAGGRDQVMSREDADVMARALGVQTVVIDHVGHLCAWEDPAAVAAALRPLVG